MRALSNARKRETDLESTWTDAHLVQLSFGPKAFFPQPPPPRK